MLVPPRLLFALSALPLPATAAPSEPRRDIFSLLAGDSDTSSAPHHTRPTLNPFTSASASPLAKLSPTASRLQSSLEQPTPSPTPRTDSAEPTAVKTALVSTPSIPPAPADSRATDHSSKTWQIIGIAIISVLFIATSITCAMFFDRLWRFLRDVICCTSRPLVSEEFIPDCEKQAWETKTLSPSPSSFDNYNGEFLCKDASAYTTRPRGLPWNTDTQDWNVLRRQASQRNDHPPTA